MEYFIVISSILLVAIVIKLFLKDRKPTGVSVDLSQEARIDMIQALGRLNTSLSDMNASLEKVPSKTLQTIQGSANNSTGKLGELIQLLKLKEAYDRVIPLSSVADFLCVKLATDVEAGSIHFVEVKSNKSSLSSDQKKFRALFEQPGTDISFKTVKVEVS